MEQFDEDSIPKCHQELHRHNTNRSSTFHLPSSILLTAQANAGTYHRRDAWLVVDLNTHLCAIVYRPGYEIWSGWRLSDAQFQHATTLPYSLGGGALAVFGDILESIIQVESHEELDELVNKYMDIYKAHGSERFNEASERSLSDCFAVLDNYIPPHMAEGMTLQPNHIQSLDVAKEKVNRSLAVLEKNEN